MPTMNPNKHENANSALSTAAAPDAVRRAVANCRLFGVTKVKPAIHHGCLRFLMADEGSEENLGGIVYSENSYSLEDLKKLSEEVNEIISQSSD